MKRIALLILALLSILIPNKIANGQTPTETIKLPEGFIAEIVVDGIPSAGAAAIAPNGMIFLAGKHGVVLTYENGQLNPNPFVDISSEVNSYWDRGLLGIAVHPQFPQKPYIYLLHTFDPPGTEQDGQGSRVNRLIRVSADPADLSKSIPSSKVVILGKNSTLENIGDEKNAATVDKPACFDQGKKEYIEDCLPSDSPSHSIGSVMFGIDGSLFVGMGEGSHFEFLDQRAARAQNLNALSGKILRINAETGEGLPDNPFYSGNPADNKSRVWDYGLRNPFRFSQNPETGDLLIGDVGWNLWEEINTGKGKNFGWPCFEGAMGKNLPQPGFESNPEFVDICQPLYTTDRTVTPPIYSYATDKGGAIVVGPVYSGNSYPEDYHGVLFFGDFDRNTIRYLHQEPDGTYESHDFATGENESDGPVQLISGQNGDLYVVIYNKDSDTSRLVRFIFDPGGKKFGHISVSASPVEGKIPLNVEFRITSTSISGQSPAEYEWDFGDGIKGTGSNVIHSYAKKGVFKARVSARQIPSSIISNEIVIHAGNSSPVPEILSPAYGYLYRTGDRVDLIGKAIDPEDGEILPAQLKWDVMIHHKNHVHSDFFHGVGRTASLIVPDHGDKVWLEACLTAADSQQLEKKVCQALIPKTSTVTFSSDPPGLNVVYEGESKTTPFEETPVINSMMEIDTQQNQFCMSFDHWSDGGPRSHSSLIGENGISLTAFYKSSIPKDWISSPIGSNVDGNGCLVNGEMFIWPSETGLSDTSDSLNFLYTTKDDDFSLKTEIPFDKERLSPELSGFLVRQSLSPDSPSLFLGWDGERKLQIMNRSSNSQKYQKATINSLPLKSFQQIVRQGDKYTWSQSSDGLEWEQIGIITFASEQPDLVGLVVFDPKGEDFGPVEFKNTQIIYLQP